MSEVALAALWLAAWRKALFVYVGSNRTQRVTKHLDRAELRAKVAMEKKP